MVDILAQSDQAKLWGALNQVHFTNASSFLASYRPSIANSTNATNSTSETNSTSKQSSTGVIMGNETVRDFYFDQYNKHIFNHSSLAQFNDTDMLIISIPDSLRDREVVIETKDFKYDHALAIFLDEYSTNFVKNYTDTAQAKNESVQTFFMQVTYLNCEKLSGYVRLVTAYQYIYFFFAVAYVINAMKNASRIQRFQFFVSQLAFMKVVFCLFTLAVWRRCPWLNQQQEAQQSDNFLKSFKITLQTLYQTVFCGLMFSMTMGLKISK